MFPYYLAIGMSPEQFWDQDPWLTMAYRQAHELKNEQHNQEMWVQGLYVYEAFGVVIHNALKKKGDKPLEYPEEPFPLTIEEKERRESRDRERAMLVSKAKFEAWAGSLKIEKAQDEAENTE